MAEKPGSTAWAMVFVLAMFLQVAFAFAGAAESPTKAAVEFSKAYYRLNPNMAFRICEEQLAVDDIDIVENYIYAKTVEAKSLGFDVSWMKQKLYHIETETLSRDDTMAKVHLTGMVRKEINPVFAWVASIFFLGDTHHVDHVLDLVNEDGKWKVCGTLNDLSQT